jgi:hypothetical protein
MGLEEAEQAVQTKMRIPLKWGIEYGEMGQRQSEATALFAAIR